MRSKGNHKLMRVTFSQAKKYHPEFSPRINELIQSGKVKVYNSLSDFKNRNNENN